VSGAIEPILPGATLGVLGGGQLGRMFAIAARRMGYRVHVLAPEDDTPTGQVADRETQADYKDLDAVAEFSQSVAAVTFEFENVPSATTEQAARFSPVRPDGSILHTTQNRLREKTFLRDAGLPVTPFEPIRSPEALRTAMTAAGKPGVLKTAAWGYDGKGQTIIRDADGSDAAWSSLGTQEAILETFIDFDCELSVVAARGADGAFEYFGPMRNDHVKHILDTSVYPAGLPGPVEREAVEITRAVVESLDLVGVLCVEFFCTRDGKLMINELAPRPHNSGHLTIDACESCQFEQQVRAVCGLPLASTRLHSPAAMANLLGDLWFDSSGSRRTPNWPAALKHPDVKLHLYGKREPRVGRKMGHLTALSPDAETICRQASAARNALSA
jgi:5-(carboxyamino)imidazole ribonucleotide synthase